MHREVYGMYQISSTDDEQLIGCEYAPIAIHVGVCAASIKDDTHILHR